MDCREFRNKHVGFVDDLLPAFDMDAMQRHLNACPRCARQHTMVRRSLLIVHNLPRIEPSAEFIQRLNARLAQLSPESRIDVVAKPRYLPSLGTFVALAAGVAAVAYLATETTNYFSPAPAAPQVAVAADIEPASGVTQMTNAAIVASVPTGIPVWPVVLVAGQTPMHFASLDFRESEQAR